MQSELRFITKYGNALPNDVLRQILLTLADLRNEAALAITRIFRRIKYKRLAILRRINARLMEINEGAILYVGPFLDIYATTRSGEILQ